MRVTRLSMATALAALLLASICGFAADCNFTRVQLQDESLAILRKDYPAREFSAGESAELIRMKQGEFVTRPFVRGVLLTVVIDQPDGYQYVRKEDQPSAFSFHGSVRRR